RIIEAQSLHDAGTEIFDHYVGYCREFLENLFAFGRFEVDRYGLFSGVDCHERGAHQRVVLFDTGAQATGKIAVFGMLDLDHLGTEKHKLKAAEWAGQDVGYVQHADCMEWKSHTPITLRLFSD